MANRHKHAKVVYFVMFGYDIMTYSKPWEDLFKAVKSTPVATVANLDDSNAVFDESTSRIPSKKSVPPMKSQDDN